MSYNKEYYDEWKKKNKGKLATYEKKRAVARSESEEWKRKHSEVCKRSVHKAWKENPHKVLWQRAKYRATNKQLEFNLDITDIVIPEYCPLLGVKLEPGVTNNRQTSMSLDRIDSSKGYIKGNVQVISTKANVLKNNATKEELILFANNILKMYKDPKEIDLDIIKELL